MIETQMHRLATRLGMRDGQAYTVVCGLVVALFLAIVGLPGVFEGYGPAALGQAAASAPSSPSTTAVGDESPPSTDDITTPSLPAFSPQPGGSSNPPSGTDSTNETPPTTTAPPPPVGPSRPVGELALLAELPTTAQPDGVAVGPDGTIYVAGDDVGTEPSMLWAFSATGDAIGSWPAPDQPAARTRGLTGVAVDPDGTVWAVDASTSRLLRLDTSSDALVTVATAANIPPCGVLELTKPCEPGLLDSPPSLSGVAAGPDGSIVVADRGQGTVWKLNGKRLEVLTSFVDRLAGEGPVGLSYLYDGGLVMVVSGRLATLPPGLPAIFRLRPDESEPEHVVDLGVGEIPGDIVASDASRLYVTIPSLGIVADIGLDQGDRIDTDVSASEPTFRTPMGAALRNGSLLLTDHVNRVFDLAVLDRPVS
ncbi:hypothetical protein [Actinospongicola halichondriae]|uniref:hypothetical protein n=1 Tax=Actinospongicola halichondriae TaxID=3236844 RepID=UPI003D435137